MTPSPAQLAIAHEEIGGRSAEASPLAQAGGEWTAILLAGERPGGDLLARHFGARSKASIKVGGMSMIRRVADTLLSVPQIGRIVILAQDADFAFAEDAAELRRNPRIRIEPSGAGIASSIAAATEAGKTRWPVLVTTADHVLLTREMIEEFIAQAHDCDMAIGFGERRNIEAHYPMTKRTWLKFADGQFSGANLFALRNPRVLSALRFWSGIEQDRKKGWKLIARFGPRLLVRAVTRTIALEPALERAGVAMHLFAKPIIMRDPEAAIDVDKPADHFLAEQILRTREANRSGLAPEGPRSDI